MQRVTNREFQKQAVLQQNQGFRSDSRCVGPRFHLTTCADGSSTQAPGEPLASHPKLEYAHGPAEYFPRMPYHSPRAFLPLCFAMVGFQASALAEPLEEWTVRSSRPYLWGVAAGPDRIVAVGRVGTILSSADAVSWSTEESGIQTGLIDVCHTGDAFIAVGFEGRILHSVDGQSWTRIESGLANFLSGVSWDALSNYGVICGEAGTVLSSRDGRNWQRESSGSGTELTAVAQANGLAVAVGRVGTVIYSTIPGQWKTGVSGTSRDLLGVVSVDDHFLALGEDNAILVSTNGLNWRDQGRPGDYAFYDADQINGINVVVGSPGRRLVSYGKVSTSPSLGEWVEHSPAINAIHSLAAFKGQLVGVGAGGLIATTQDGMSWNIVRCSPVDRLWRITYADEAWWLGGHPAFQDSAHIGPYVSGIYRSTNRMEWQPVLVSNEPAILASARGADQVVAVGTRGGIWTRLHSAEQWTKAPSFTSGELADVAWGAGRFVAVGTENTGRGVILHSDNGRDWARVALPASATALRHIGFGNGVFVAGGESLVMTSNDGRAWSTTVLPMTSPGVGGLFGIAFGNGRFVALNNRWMYVSQDGVDWVTLGMVGISDVAYGEGWFVRVGSGGRIESSLDGLEWSARATLGDHGCGRSRLGMADSWRRVTMGPLWNPP